MLGSSFFGPIALQMPARTRRLFALIRSEEKSSVSTARAKSLRNHRYEHRYFHSKWVNCLANDSTVCSALGSIGKSASLAQRISGQPSASKARAAVLWHVVLMAFCPFLYMEKNTSATNH